MNIFYIFTTSISFRFISFPRDSSFARANRTLAVVNHAFNNDATIGDCLFGGGGGGKDVSFVFGAAGGSVNGVLDGEDKYCLVRFILLLLANLYKFNCTKHSSNCIINLPHNFLIFLVFNAWPFKYQYCYYCVWIDHDGWLMVDG